MRIAKVIDSPTAGVITAIEADTAQLSARLDAASGPAGREVSWSAAEFDLGTGMRDALQRAGKTLDCTYFYHYFYHTHHFIAGKAGSRLPTQARLIPTKQRRTHYTV